MHGDKAYREAGTTAQCSTERRPTLTEQARKIEGTLAELDSTLERIMDYIRPSPTAGQCGGPPDGMGLEESLLRCVARADELLQKVSALGEIIDNRPAPARMHERMA